MFAEDYTLHTSDGYPVYRTKALGERLLEFGATCTAVLVQDRLVWYHAHVKTKAARSDPPEANPYLMRIGMVLGVESASGASLRDD